MTRKIKKSFLILVMVIVTISGYPQLRTDRETNTFKYDSVVAVPNVNRDVLSERAELWVNSTYPEQIVKSEANTVVCVGHYLLEEALNPSGTLFKYTIQIDTKDEKYRYQIKDFQISYDTPNVGALNHDVLITNRKMKPLQNKLNKKYSTRLGAHINETIKSLNETISKTESDW